MNKLKILLFSVFYSFVNVAFAQQEVEMADTMRSEGKIYVVVAILVLILLGLLAYVFFTDKKISRLEVKINEKRAEK